MVLCGLPDRLGTQAVKGERLRYYLAVWVEWMHHPEIRLGYPDKSCVFASSGISGFDDLSESVENTDALSVDAVIHGLPMPQKMAIEHFHLHSVYRFNRLNIEEQYELALDSLWSGLLSRGLS